MTDRSDSTRFGFLAFAWHLWALVALALSNLAVLVSIVAVPFAVGKRATAELERWRSFGGILSPLALYVLVVLISVAVSLDPGASLGEADELLSLVTLPLAVVWVRNADRVRTVMNGIVIMATGSAVWGLAQFLAGYGDLERRIRGPFSHYMTFAGILLIAELIVIARITCRRPSFRSWHWAACLVITAALIGSLTRSAWVALAVTLILLALVRKPKTLLVWVPAAVVVVAMFAPPVRERATSIFDLRNTSNYDRISMLDAGLEMVRERPFFGLGPGMARHLYPVYRPLSAPRHTVQHLHSTYLQIAADSGLLGLLAYLWLLGAGLVVALEGFRRSRRARLRASAPRGDPPIEEMYLASFLGIFAFGIAGLFEANWIDTEVQRLVLFLLAVPFVLDAGGTPSEAVAVSPGPATRSGEMGE